MSPLPVGRGLICWPPPLPLRERQGDGALLTPTPAGPHTPPGLTHPADPKTREVPRSWT
jgi:hypothetical protein